jgi:hypothetical protein
MFSVSVHNIKLNVCSIWRIVRLEVDTFLSIHFGYVHNFIHSIVENLNVTSILWNNLIKIILGPSGSSMLLCLQTIWGLESISQMCEPYVVILLTWRHTWTTWTLTVPSVARLSKTPQKCRRKEFANIRFTEDPFPLRQPYWPIPNLPPRRRTLCRRLRYSTSFGSLMVCGGITERSRTPLVVVNMWSRVVLLECHVVGLSLDERNNWTISSR